MNTEQKMHAYLLILEVTPLQVGAIYDMLPLHCTLVHWFWLQQEPDEVTRKLTDAFGPGAITLKAGKQQVFMGKNKNGEDVPVTVNDIELTSQLRDLHDRACTVLDAMGVQYSEPRYVYEGYHPHVTHQKDGALAPGEVRRSPTIYLVEAAGPEYGNERTVKAAIKL